MGDGAEGPAGASASSAARLGAALAALCPRLRPRVTPRGLDLGGPRALAAAGGVPGAAEAAGRPPAACEGCGAKAEAAKAKDSEGLGLVLEWDLDFGRRAMAVRGARWCCLRCQAVTDLGWFVAFATTTAFAATTADLPFGRADLVRHLAAANGRGADDDAAVEAWAHEVFVHAYALRVLAGSVRWRVQLADGAALRSKQQLRALVQGARALTTSAAPRGAGQPGDRKAKRPGAEAGGGAAGGQRKLKKKKKRKSSG